MRPTSVQHVAFSESAFLVCSSNFCGFPSCGKITSRRVSCTGVVPGGFLPGWYFYFVKDVFRRHNRHNFFDDFKNRYSKWPVPNNPLASSPDERLLVDSSPPPQVCFVRRTRGPMLRVGPSLGLSVGTVDGELVVPGLPVGDWVEVLSISSARSEMPRPSC